ncbi:MAG: SDR family NAD(P)-dependent oxidoreductase [Candidatus Parabeggiatoa sp.]|nr:SDR family NAD(P)-dependent oxidoreductase [Candidatus Parabeggiatoa sp.]
MTKTALITGASGDIGQAIATRLCEENYDLILVSRTQEKLEQVVTHLRGKYPNQQINFKTCDVADHEPVAKLFETLVVEKAVINVLVNCAGVSGGGVTAELENELWLNVINTNLNGAFFVTRDALRHKLIPAGGRIINIASTGGKQGVIHAVPYSASKHGLIGMTKALGLELAKNRSLITVNAVCPGFVESKMAQKVRKFYANIWNTDVDEAKRRIEERVPLGRYIEPSEVAEMVAYLTSPHAAGVTAQALNVCGGLGNY